MAREFKTNELGWLQTELERGSLTILDPGDPLRAPWDAEYKTRSGTRYLGTFATLEDLHRLMNIWQTTGECLGGRYLWLSDLVVVDELDPQIIADVVEDLVRSGEFKSALSRANDDDEA